MPTILRLLTATVTAGAVTLVASPACAEEPRQSGAPRLLGSVTIPHGMTVDGTAVGGLSGIDRDPDSGDYVLISDDRSERDPARLYTAEIDVDAEGLHGAKVTAAHTLRDRHGDPFPPLDECADPGCEGTPTVDPESVRVDPETGGLWWTTEGERRLEDGRRVLLDPQVRLAERSGTTTRVLPTPRKLRMSPAERGPRRNQALEALTLAPDGHVVTAMEGPLYRDGPEASPDEGAVVRLTETDRDGRVRAQYGYEIEPVYTEPDPADGDANNGVSEILADPERPGSYLVVERHYVAGAGNEVRLYRADTTGADDVRRVPSIDPDEPNAPRPASKELVADLGDLGLDHVDNIEGITWGPDLATGERSLLLVSDNNFSVSQQTQVVALAVR